MTKTFYPFDAGDGYQVNEAQWAEMSKHWLRTGVLRDFLNELEVTADASGMEVSINSGGAYVEGYFFKSTAEEPVAIAGADPTNDRIDRVVVHLDPTSNEIDFAVLTGTPAGVPNAPALSQSAGGIWEISLAQVLVDSGVSSIAADKVTDERGWAQAITDAASEYDEGSGNLTTTATSAQLVADTVIELNTSGGDVKVDFNGIVAHQASGQSVTVFVRVDGTDDYAFSINMAARTDHLMNATGFVYVTDLDPGLHTFQLYYQNTGSGTATLSTRRMFAREIRR